VNLWLVFHLAAIMLAPASVGPSSELVRAAWTVCRPYLQLLYLNHGYHYFAPEPGPSTLVAFTARGDSGLLAQGRIPDRQIKPRLLYHRYFMLTEHLNTAPPELRQPWCASYAEHLCRKYGARDVGLTRVTHLLPSPQMVRAGVRLDDPAGYTEQPLGIFRCDEF
jgi:hypothetical protein